MAAVKDVIKTLTQAGFSCATSSRGGFTVEPGSERGYIDVHYRDSKGGHADEDSRLDAYEKILKGKYSVQRAWGYLVVR